MRLNSRHLTSIEYGSDVRDSEGKRVTLHRGVNTITDEDASFLRASPSFQKHSRAGMFVELPAEDVKQPEQVEQPAPPAPSVDPRARKPKESVATYAARMKLLDDEAAAADAEFFTAYDAMTPEEQTAMYGTLTPEEKALIDGRAKV